MLAIGTLISSLTEEPVIAIIVSAVFGLIVLFFNNLVSFLPDGVVPTIVFFGLIFVGIAVLFYLDTKKLWISLVTLVAGGGIITGLYFWQKDWFAYGLTTSLSWISLEKRYEEFLNGILNLSSVVYMVSVTILCLFVTTQVVERRRWR
jgi:ABC-2 type transport system permease protein